MHNQARLTSVYDIELVDKRHCLCKAPVAATGQWSGEVACAFILARSKCYARHAGPSKLRSVAVMLSVRALVLKSIKWSQDEFTSGVVSGVPFDISQHLELMQLLPMICSQDLKRDVIVEAGVQGKPDGGKSTVP